MKENNLLLTSVSNKLTFLETTELSSPERFRILSSTYDDLEVIKDLNYARRELESEPPPSVLRELWKRFYSAGSLSPKGGLSQNDFDNSRRVVPINHEGPF